MKSCYCIHLQNFEDCFIVRLFQRSVKKLYFNKIIQIFQLVQQQGTVGRTSLVCTEKKSLNYLKSTAIYC